MKRRSNLPVNKNISRSILKTYEPRNPVLRTTSSDFGLDRVKFAFIGKIGFKALVILTYIMNIFGLI